MNITELRDRVQALPTLEHKLENLQRALHEARDDVSLRLQQYERERGDVERLENESLSSFLLQLVGRYEDKLEKEQQEEIAAKLAYDHAATRLDSLIRERDTLDSRIRDLRMEEKSYEVELAHRRMRIGELDAESAAYYENLAHERYAIIAHMTEIQEALNAAARAKSTAHNALNSLKSAQGWATFDAFTRGGLISHMAKYSHIDSAEQTFSILSSQLRNLRTELDDVAGMSMDGLTEISSTQRAVDFWFDNIFTDLSVRERITDNIGQIDRLIQNIARAEASLAEKLLMCETELTANRSAEETLLVSL